MAVIPWASLPFFAFFRIHQVPEALLTNIGFIVITILFIRRSIQESREGYEQLSKLAGGGGQVSLSKLDLIDQMFKQLQSSGISPSQRFEINLNTVGLTAREKEIVRLIKVGKAYKVIADELFISERTVSKHVQNIFEKTRRVKSGGATESVGHMGKWLTGASRMEIRVFTYVICVFLRRLDAVK